MFLVTPTADALQILMNISETHAREHNILHNTTKTVYMATPLKNSKGQHVQVYARGVPK